MYNKSYILLSKHVFFCLFFFVLFCFFVCVSVLLLNLHPSCFRGRAGPGAPDDGAWWLQTRPRPEKRQREKDGKKVPEERRGEEERGEEDEGVSGCSPHQRTRLLNRWLLSLLVSPVASSWSPEAQSPSSSTQRETDTHRDREEMNPVEGDKFTC